MDAMHSAIHSSGDDRSNGASVSAASPRTDGDISAESLRDLHASAAEPLLGSSRSSASASASPLVKRSAAAATSAYEPIENGNVAATSTSVPMREVHVDLYIRGRGKSGKGKGPACSFAAQLLGWHADRLDVAAIKRRHGLKALFALSSTGVRGLELVANPRNGLSLTTYTGKPGSRITLDGEPQREARALELVRNPRNGRSLTTYTGKPGSRIPLDGEPKLCDCEGKRAGSCGLLGGAEGCWEARGFELVGNPRNGLSLTTYTGKPGSRIALDADPQVCF
ncbi:unnamed protein product [Closterium sp. NIES-64]|nr:unnamed protein product [Closterium sp. NIES-65]CAI5990571.1 unnamed protein product [Closterium sp. NIES-64]CAI6001743.1 unnamed protein product [Closterium sp. NIES-65]